MAKFLLSIRNWSSSDVEIGLEPEGDVRVLNKDYECDMHVEVDDEPSEFEIVVRDGQIAVFSSGAKRIDNLVQRNRNPG